MIKSHEKGLGSRGLGVYSIRVSFRLIRSAHACSATRRLMTRPTLVPRKGPLSKGRHIQGNNHSGGPCLSVGPNNRSSAHKV